MARSRKYGATWLLIVISLSNLCFAQDQKVRDSLKAIIETSPNIRTRIDALNEYAFEYLKADADSSMFYADQALTLSKQINYHKGLAGYYDCIGSLLFQSDADSSIRAFKKCIEEYRLAGDKPGLLLGMNNLGNVYLVNEDYDSALNYERSALAVIRNDESIAPDIRRKTAMLVLESLGNIFYYTSYYDSSIFYAQTALMIAEMDGNKSSQSTNLITIANVHEAQENLPLAISTLQRAAQLDQKEGNDRNYIFCLTNMATYIVESNGDLAKARSMADSAIVRGNAIGYYQMLPHNLMTIGDIEAAKKSYSSAFHYYRMALEACRKYPNKFIEGATQISMGNAYIKTGNPMMANVSFCAALANCSDDLESMMICYNGLADAAAAQHQYSLAYGYQKKYDVLKDSVFNDKKQKTINELEIRYQTNKKQEEIQQLAISNELHIARADRTDAEKKMIYGSFAAVLLAGGIGFYRFRKTKRIEKEHAILMDRLQIGRDLHDNLAASISSISISSAAVKQKLSRAQTAQAIKMIDAICVDSQDIVATMSDTLWFINPKNDSFDKLTDRMHALASGMLSAHEISLRFLADEQLDNFPIAIDRRKNIYLIFKEAINNILKYAGATEVLIKIENTGQVLRLSITDNGTGFPVTANPENLGGNGIKNMEERAKQAGGTLCITSMPGKGVEIIFECPLPG